MTFSMKKGAFLITLAGLILLFSGPPLQARTVWKTGIVTKAPWFDRHRRIEVDNEPYLFMPENVRLARHYIDSSGAWQEEPLHLRELYKGRKVWMRVEGNRIYELFVEE